ncbi:hypothetical protein PV08_04676 [Exophiala spinifera]|uniref:Uncharacterized protein n=1 Tax=Exophiala spinifera TaxID=91928 RepID=A0A0D1ZXY3_9EURO|nr:uncharacterized protein PV08_04676 [Exophiala spinifera]KIW17482.1 hypothetical protein PV08_04676 [Exophiala spinifera]
MASAFHRCQFCGYETDLSNNIAVFEENPHCRQCGLSASESDTKMQEDLINLMTRNLQLNPIQHQHDMSMPPTPQVVPQASPITYITQHYHHSAHQVQSDDLPVSSIIEQAGINASALFPSQLQLFKHADSEQRSRLIQLWQIAPPGYGNQMHPDALGNWPQTSMEREEEAARYRLEVAEQDKMKNLWGLPDAEARNAEPYMTHGYATDDANRAEASTTAAKDAEYRHSNDPAYDSREWWHLSDGEPMEHQYGMLQQMWGYGFNNSATKNGGGDADMS